MRADRRLYTDKYGKLVEEAQADFLLAAKGHEIAPELVKHLDLRVWSDGRVMQGPEPVVEEIKAYLGVVAAPEPAPVVPDEPLADVVRPAGAMPEPILPPEARRSRKKY